MKFWKKNFDFGQIVSKISIAVKTLKNFDFGRIFEIFRF